MHIHWFRINGSSCFCIYLFRVITITQLSSGLSVSRRERLNLILLLGGAPINELFESHTSFDLDLWAIQISLTLVSVGNIMRWVTHTLLKRVDDFFLNGSSDANPGRTRKRLCAHTKRAATVITWTKTAPHKLFMSFKCARYPVNHHLQ